MLLYGLLSLFYDYQCVVFHNALTGFDADGCYLAILLRLDVVSHLHGLQYQQRVASLHLIANIDVDRCDNTRKWGLDGVVGVDVSTCLA